MPVLTYVALDNNVRQYQQNNANALAARISGGLLGAADSAYDNTRVVRAETWHPR